MKKINLLLAAGFISVIVLGGCSKKNSAAGREIAVYIPGVMSGSPIYEMLSSGVQRAADEVGGITVTIVEAGYNQSEWETKLTALAAQQKFDLIVSSNPSLPELANTVSKKFPASRFLLLDGELSGNPSIYTLRYNQREQSYMSGYLGALLAGEAAAERKNRTGNSGNTVHIGLIAAQNYPVMNNTILPGYLRGARAVMPDISVDFRIVGNWFDAAKAMELASGMISEGVDVILTIAGSANEGVLQAAAEKNAKILWFDVNAYSLRPGIIAGCSVLRQEKAAYDKTMSYIRGELPFGVCEKAGIQDGYIDFIDYDPLYLSTVSAEVREQQAVMLEKLRSGALQLAE
jgi:simple sugar transport system substrate-binding protein